MPVITLPDGREVEFPEGTSPEVMTQAVRKFTGWKAPGPSAEEQQTIDLANQGFGGAPSMENIAAAGRGVSRGIWGNLAPYVEAASLPSMVTNLAQGRTPMQAARETAQNDKALAAKNPVSNIAGTLAGSVVPAAAAVPLTAWRTAAGAGPKALEAARYLAANAGLGAATGATEGDSIKDRLSNALMGAGIGAAGAVAVPAVVGGVQGLYNAGKAGLNTLRQLGTQSGREGIAGQVLRDATGAPMLPEVQTPPIPGLTYNAAQATQNPTVASMADTLGVANQTLPAQTEALAKTLIGGTDRAPDALLNRASAQGTDALASARDAMIARGKQLWLQPDLQMPLGITKDELVTSARAAYPNAPPAFGHAINAAAAELADAPTIREANRFRSSLITQARKAGASLDLNATYAANAMNAGGKAALETIEGSPTLAGRAATPDVPYLNAQGQPMGGMPRIAGTPEIVANPQAQSAYAGARAYTNERAGLLEQLGKRYPQVRDLMRGDETVNPDKVFRGLFDMDGGSGTGPQRMQELQDFLYRIGTPEANAAADKLAHAAQRFVRTAIYDKARTGSGVNVEGREILNPERMAEAIRAARGWVPRNDLTKPIAGELDNIEQAANVIASPGRMRERVGSQTFERANMQDMIRQLVAQNGGQALTVPLGAYAGYEYGPLPGGGVVNAAAGAAAGSLVGRRGGGALARMVPNSVATPLTRDVEEKLAAALMDYPALKKAMETRMLDIPKLTDQSELSRLLMMIGRGSTPALAGAASQ
jgi:hypothetical protein